MFDMLLLHGPAPRYFVNTVLRALDTRYEVQYACWFR